MSIILGFAFFILFFALSSLISPLAGRATAFALSLVMTGFVYFERSPLSPQLRRARGAAAPRSIGPGRTQQMPNSRHLSEMFR
jgi:hypothetical protein